MCIRDRNQLDLRPRELLTNLRRQTGGARFVVSHSAVFDRDSHRPRVVGYSAARLLGCCPPPIADRPLPAVISARSSSPARSAPTRSCHAFGNATLAECRTSPCGPCRAARLRPVSYTH